MIKHSWFPPSSSRVHSLSCLAVPAPWRWRIYTVWELACVVEPDADRWRVWSCLGNSVCQEGITIKMLWVMHPSQCNSCANYVWEWTLQFTHHTQRDKNKCWDAHQRSDDKQTAHAGGPGTRWIPINNERMSLCQAIQHCELVDRKFQVRELRCKTSTVV